MQKVHEIIFLIGIISTSLVLKTLICHTVCSHPKTPECKNCDAEHDELWYNLWEFRG